MGLDLIDTLLAPCTHTYLLEVNVFSPENVSGYIVTAIAAIINLLISYFIIRHFIYKPIKKVSAQRKADIAKNLDSAKAAKAEAEAETEKVKAELADAKLKAATIIAQAKEQADTKRQIMLDAAKKRGRSLFSEQGSRTETCLGSEGTGTARSSNQFVFASFATTQ